MAKKKMQAKAPEAEYFFAVRTVTVGESFRPGDRVPRHADIATLLRQGNIYRLGDGVGEAPPTIARGNWIGVSHAGADTDAQGRPI